MPSVYSSTQFILTAVILAAALSTIAALAISERKPRTSLTPSLIPRMPLMMGSVIVALMALVHLITLLGGHTGR